MDGRRPPYPWRGTESGVQTDSSVALLVEVVSGPLTCSYSWSSLVDDGPHWSTFARPKDGPEHTATAQRRPSDLDGTGVVCVGDMAQLVVGQGPELAVDRSRSLGGLLCDGRSCR
jgi:hypothetical protein